MEGIQEKHELSVEFHHPVEENQTDEQNLGLGFQNPNLADQTLDHQSVCDQEDGLSEKLHDMGIEDKDGLIGEKNDEVSEKNDVEGDVKDCGAEDEENYRKSEAKGEESEGNEENGGGFKEVKEGGFDKEGSKWSEIEEENENGDFEVKKDEGVAGEKEDMNEYENGWDEKWNDGAGRNEVNEGKQYFDNYENEGYRKEKCDGEAHWYGNVEGDSVELNDGNNGSYHYPLRPDAEDCSYYIRTGDCKYGSNCRFNHPLRRKNQAARDMFKQKEESFDRPGPTECKYHFTPGGCKYGKACRYNHGSAKAPPSQDFNFLGLPIRVGEKECPYYMKTSSCKYGSNCRFNHPDPTVVGGGDSASQGNVKDTISGWSSARTLNENAPFMPVIYPPSPTAPPNAKWNEYQAPVYPTSERNLPTPPAFSLRPMNIPATDANFYAYPRQQLIVDEFPERPGQPECSYYLKTGDCKYRSTCKFHHPRNRKTSFTLSEKGLPLRPDQSICSYYSRYGICKYGPACKYDHSVTNDTSAQSDQGQPPQYGSRGDADGNWRREPMQQSV